MQVSKKYSNIVLFLCLFIAQWHLLGVRTECDNWKKIIESDVYGYYGYLPAIFIHRSFDYSIYQQVDSQKPGLKGASEGPIKYYIGEAILLLPFFTAADLITQTFDFDARNGYSYYYQLFIAIAGIFYLLIGLLAMRNLLSRLGFDDLAISLVLFFVFAGTQLYHYSLHEPGMSHVYSFGMISLALNAMHLQIANPRKARWILIALIAAVIVFIRPVNLLFLFGFLLLSKSYKNARLFVISFFKSGFRTLAFSILIVTGFFFLQALSYYYQSGKWWVYSYGEEGFNWANPQIFNVLFSYRKGLFVYTPLLLVSLSGLWFMRKKLGAFSFWSWLAIMSAYLFVTASWWYWAYGGSFGMRPFIDSYALWAIPLACLVDAALKSKVRMLSLLSICGFLVFLNLVQTYQYIHAILPYEHMNKDRYWHIFLKTDYRYRYAFPADPEEEIVPESLSLIKDTATVKNKIFLVNSDYKKIEFIGMPLKNLIPAGKSVNTLLIEGELNVESLKTNSSFVTALQEDFNQPAVFFHTKYLVALVNKSKTWIPFRYRVDLPKDSNFENHFTFYLYNEKKESVQARNLSVHFWGSL